MTHVLCSNCQPPTIEFFEDKGLYGVELGGKKKNNQNGPASRGLPKLVGILVLFQLGCASTHGSLKRLAQGWSLSRKLEFPAAQSFSFKPLTL